MADERQRLYPADEIVALVHSLDRPQDQGLFSRDVLLVYPELADKYTKVCPRRCDIATAAQKAANDAYSYDTKLTALREDVQLMVDNCHRFNGTTGPLADIANSFEKFAMEQIDAYVAKKTGGRRASSFRLSTVAKATTATPKTRGKRQRNEEGQSQPMNRSVSHNNNNKSESGGSNGSSGSSSSSSLTTADLVKLADSLNRREDKGAFAVDVATAYPDLKKSYEAICPEKMNLTIVRERAASGYYLGRQPQQVDEDGGVAPSIFGNSIAESLVLLRKDVELMVSNCIRFNANSRHWVQLAQSFQAFAHKKVDDFVVRHAPFLKGSKSGVDLYTGKFPKTQEEQQQQQQQERCIAGGASSQGEEPIDPNATPILSASSVATTPTVGAPPLSKKALILSSTAAGGGGGVNLPHWPPVVSAVHHVTPTILPTALQPMFKTPDALRRRLVADHIHKETLHWRCVRSAGDDEMDSRTDGADSRTFSSALSCRAALQAFATSVHEFYRSKRERQDFADPFEYPRQEEQFYMDCIALIEQQFERLFLHILLYERERADVHSWVAARAVRQAVASGSVSDTACSCFWLDEAHLCYLVRFLQHLPQLIGLACATVAPHSSATTDVPDSRPALVLTTVANGVVEKFAKITEEMLEFIAQYEQKIEGVSDIAELPREA